MASVVVPVALTPGTFGFDKWPSATREQVAETQLRVAPPRVQVALAEPARREPKPAPVRSQAVATVAPAPSATELAVAPASPHRLAATPAPVRTPAAQSAPDHPAASAPAPQTPATPAPAAPAPAAPVPAAATQVASAAQPALRNDAPVPEPEPAEPPVHVPTAVVPAPVAHHLPAPVRAIVERSGAAPHGHDCAHRANHSRGGHHED